MLQDDPKSKKGPYPAGHIDPSGEPLSPEEEKPFHSIVHDFDECLQHDEEQQHDAMVDAEEALAMSSLADDRKKKRELHELADKVRGHSLDLPARGED